MTYVSPVYQRERRARLRAEGRCVACGLLSDGKSRCPPCRQIVKDRPRERPSPADRVQAARRQKERRDELRKAGLCIECARPKASRGGPTCRRVHGVRSKPVETLFAADGGSSDG